MLTEVVSRLSRVRIPRTLTPIGPNQYEVCAHWWSWWGPHNPNLVWNFTDEAGNIVSAQSTYSTDPVVITTSAPVPNLFLYIPTLPTFVKYFSEIPDAAVNIDRPTLFLFAESEVKWNKYDFITSSFQSVLVIPAKDNIDAFLNQQIHDGFLRSIREYFIHALIDVESAEWVPNHVANRSLGGSGSGLFSVKATILLMTLSFTYFS